MLPCPEMSSPAPPASRRLPWDIHPALSGDRLRICARLLAHARRDAIRMASYEMGDTTWSVGCRAYAFGQQRMRRVAEKRTYNWLSVLDHSHHFVFLIQDVPVRFFRGSADEPTARTLRRQHNEVQQLDLALGEDLAQGLVFRLALEAGAAEGVDRVVFLALRGALRTNRVGASQPLCAIARRPLRQTCVAPRGPHCGRTAPHKCRRRYATP